MAPGNSTLLYKFTGAAGDRLYLDSLTSGANGQWRLIDPLGRQVVRTGTNGDQGPGLLERDGSSTLLAEGRAASADESVPVELQVTNVLEKRSLRRTREP